MFVFVGFQDARAFDLTRVEVINVLGDEKVIEATLGGTMLLKLNNGLVTRICLLVLRQLDEIVVPFPDRHRVLSEEVLSQDLHGVRLTAIPFSILPEAVLSTESWYTACCADPRAR